MRLRTFAVAGGFCAALCQPEGLPPNQFATYIVSGKRYHSPSTPVIISYFIVWIVWLFWLFD